MKRLIIATLALVLSACTVATAPPSTGVMAKADTVILTGERGFAAAELGYITAASGVAILVRNGAITGSTATLVRSWNAPARDVLVRGKATADMAEKARLATQLFGITDKLNALKGSK